MKKEINYTAEFAAKFKLSYAYKMGGTQTIQLPNGQQFEFNDKEYYSGRGAKYNAGIKHDNKGLILVSRKQLSAALKTEKERKLRIKELIAEREAASKRYADNAAAGVYGIAIKEYGTFIELSESESEGKYFDAKMLAKTLNISEADAGSLKSMGKTYVFANKLDGSGTLEIYHSSLYCNDLYIRICEATPERMAEFIHSEWASAPFAGNVGMTSNPNHFVC